MLENVSVYKPSGFLCRLSYYLSTTAYPWPQRKRQLDVVRMCHEVDRLLSQSFFCSPPSFSCGLLPHLLLHLFFSELAGCKKQFITLAGFHSDGLIVSRLAKEYGK